MKCDKCKQQIPEDSIYCPFCGSRIGDNPKTEKRVTNRSSKGTANKTRKSKNKSKSGLIVIVVVLILLAGTVGVYFYSYNQSVAYATQGDFTKAGQYLIIPGITKIHDPYIYDFIVAGMNYDQGNYTLAKEKFQQLAIVSYLNAGDMYAKSRDKEAQAKMG